MQGLTYFQAKGGAKRKADSLLDEREVKEKLASCTQHEALRDLPLKQHAHIQAMHDDIASEFTDWRLKLKTGFNLLFYGYGSKKAILDRFGMEACTDGGVLCVNGWSPGLNLRALLLKMLSFVRKASQTFTKTSGDSEALLRGLQQGVREAPLYLIIHGIDGQGLRSSESQAILAQIAALPNVHLIASVDHVNAPLLWDKSVAAQFNWLYLELTTFQPYHVETLSIQPLLCNARIENQRLGALVVLQTLVPNAREIFRILANNQLASDKDSGMTLHELFDACRARFLVTNELALRSHLNEFRDHSLIHIRRSAEGAEEIHVPVPQDLMEEILSELG